MGVLQRFERRLEGLVEGAFARVFKGAVEPVEVAAALQREAADRKAILGPGRILVPNRYVVELGPDDYERLQPYERPLTRELATTLDEHVGEQGWTTFGPVGIRLEQVDELDTGVFRVRSAVEATTTGGGLPRTAAAAGGPQLIDSSTGRAYGVRRGTTIVGRGQDAHLKLPDAGISRRHLRLDYDGDRVVLADLDSTNGTTVNRQPVRRQELRDGDQVGIGNTTLVFGWSSEMDG